MNESVIGSQNNARDAPVSVEALGHEIDGTRILSNISVSVGSGETLAIIGPSGTGKTTLLRLLALFSRPTDGRVYVDGNNVWDAPERERLIARRRVAMVFQEANLFDAPVRRNVEYGIHIRRDWRERVRVWASRLHMDRIDDRVLDALDVVGLSDLAEQNAMSLSGGEGQRVSFARALATEPDVLLLDEPTSDLDPRNTAVIEQAIGTACDRGVGVAVATHDMHQAERIADRVAVMIGGTFVEVGPTQEIFESPRDERVRRFIEGDLVF